MMTSRYSPGTMSEWAPAVFMCSSKVNSSCSSVPARGVAVAGGDVDDVFLGADIGGLGQRLADRLQGHADDGEVAAGPACLLALLAGSIVGGGGASLR